MTLNYTLYICYYNFSDVQKHKANRKLPEGYQYAGDRKEVTQIAKFTVYFKTGWRFQLVANNGENIAISEPYSSKQAAISGAQAIKRNTPDADIVVVD